MGRPTPLHAPTPTCEEEYRDDELEGESRDKRRMFYIAPPRKSSLRVCAILTIQAIASFVVCIIVLLGVRAAQQTGGSENVSTTGVLCESPECILAAANIFQFIAPEELDIDPCDNFNSFVCHNWEQSHDLPSGISGESRLLKNVMNVCLICYRVVRTRTDAGAWIHASSSCS